MKKRRKIMPNRLKLSNDSALILVLFRKHARLKVWSVTTKNLLGFTNKR